MTLAEIVQEALTDVEFAQRDYAARELAIIYADAVDKAKRIGDLRGIANIGPKLVDLLKELHMTPASRAVKSAIKAGADDDPDSADWDELTGA